MIEEISSEMLFRPILMLSRFRHLLPNTWLAYLRNMPRFAFDRLFVMSRMGLEHPFPPCTFTSSSFALFLLFPFVFLICFTYFLLCPSLPLFTRVVPLPFPGRILYRTLRRYINVDWTLAWFVVFILCYLCRFVEIVKNFLVFCCIWFSLVLQCDGCPPPVVGASVII